MFVTAYKAKTFYSLASFVPNLKISEIPNFVILRLAPCLGGCTLWALIDSGITFREFKKLNLMLIMIV